MLAIIGLMSGTSADGIDAALIHTDGQSGQRVPASSGAGHNSLQCSRNGRAGYFWLGGEAFLACGCNICLLKRVARV